MLDPVTYRKVWDEYVDFLIKHPEAGQTAMLTECYSLKRQERLREVMLARSHIATSIIMLS